MADSGTSSLGDPGGRGSRGVRRCAALLALSLLGGCQLVGDDPEPAPAPSTTAALSMADYAGRLKTGLDSVKAGVALAAGAKSYKDLVDRLAAARLTVDATVQSMRSLAVPAGTKASHDRLQQGLADLSWTLGNVQGAVEGQDVCAAPSAVAALNQTGVPGKLDTAAQELAAVTGGVFEPVQLVPVGKSVTRRLGNGAMVRRPSRSGPNAITVDNRRQHVDVVVTLARGGRPFLSVYVRSKSKARVRGVPNGNYTAYFTSGTDWDRSLRAFTRDCTFERFKGSPKLGVKPKYYTRWDFWMSDEPADENAGADEPPTAGLIP